jgi:hypothetical protein
MTFPISRGECAPGILDAGPTLKPDTVLSNAAAIDLAARFGLDRLSSDRRLVCHWAREIDGRLVCIWEPFMSVGAQCGGR